MFPSILANHEICSIEINKQKKGDQDLANLATSLVETCKL
jgi:hypothetical protein